MRAEKEISNPNEWQKFKAELAFLCTKKRYNKNKTTTHQQNINTQKNDKWKNKCGRKIKWKCRTQKRAYRTKRIHIRCAHTSHESSLEAHTHTYVQRAHRPWMMPLCICICDHTYVTAIYTAALTHAHTHTHRHISCKKGRWTQNKICTRRQKICTKL